MNRDFAEMLDALSAEAAEFLVVGAYAVAAHGAPRATGDLDLWVRPSAENAVKVFRALGRFGARLGPHGVTHEDFERPESVYQIGVVPNRIDLVTSIDGVRFDDAWRGRMAIELWGRRVEVLGRDELLRNKRATGRLKDLADVEALEALEPRT